MKSLVFLAALLLCAAPASAQLAPPPGEIDDMDEDPTSATEDARRNAMYTYSEGVQYGRGFGTEKSTTSWSIAGFASGLVGGPIGAGIVYGMAEQGVPEATRYRSGLVDAYSRDFYGGWSEGYSDTYDNRRESAALTGGVVGTVVLGGVITFFAVR